MCFAGCTVCGRDLRGAAELGLVRVHLPGKVCIAHTSKEKHE